MSSPSSVQVLNEELFAQLETPGMEKNALDAVNEFTRVRVREDGFYRKIIPPVQVSNDDLDRQVDRLIDEMWKSEALEKKPGIR